MKKSLLAMALLGAFGAASAQTSVTIYGLVDAGIYRLDNGSDGDAKTWGLGAGMQSGNRLGFRGIEDLGGGLSAVFVLENGFTIDDGMQAQGGRLFGRQAYAGLSSVGIGALKFGRQYAPIRSAVESIDPFGLGLAGNAAQMFNVYGERTDNTVNFTTADFGGFVGQLAYSFGEVAGDNGAGRNIGASAAYNNGPIRAVLAYHKQDLGTTVTPSNGNADTIMLGGYYDFGMVKVHAAYARNRGEDAAGADTVDSDDGMLGVSVPLGAGTLLASYIRRMDDSAAENDASQWALGYTYPLSKRTNLYTSYAKIKNDGTGTRAISGVAGGTPAAGDDPSIFNIGIRHMF